MGRSSIQGMGWYNASELQPYEEETVEENLTIQDIRDNNAEWLLNKLQEMSAEGALQTISDLYDELHTSQYPKTYKECFNICFGNNHPVIQVVGLDGLGNNKELFENFIKLKICRDAYWKIVGEQMGLGKPWKPKWNNDLSKCYISFYNNKVDKGVISYSNKILAFPTEEMRDAFFGNFKELINETKELL